MQREYIEAKEIVERYVRGDLSEAESDQFEQRLLWDRELQDQLELTQCLREGMRDVTTGSAPTAASRPSFFATPLYAAAATVLLAITTFGWLGTWLASKPDDVPQASGRVFSLEVVRSVPGVSALPVVRTGAAGEPVTLLVYPEFDTHPEFSIELSRLPGPPDVGGLSGQWQTVWQGASTFGAGNTVAVTLRGDLLRPGVHRLQVAGLENGQTGAVAAEVYFRVSTDE